MLLLLNLIRWAWKGVHVPSLLLHDPNLCHVCTILTSVHCVANSLNIYMRSTARGSNTKHRRKPQAAEYAPRPPYLHCRTILEGRATRCRQRFLPRGSQLGDFFLFPNAVQCPSPFTASPCRKGKEGGVNGWGIIKADRRGERGT